MRMEPYYDRTIHQRSRVLPPSLSTARAALMLQLRRLEARPDNGAAMTVALHTLRRRLEHVARDIANGCDERAIRQEVKEVGERIAYWAGGAA